MALPNEHQTTIENLSVELLSEILIRIPAKPLAQMRCVSKPWNDLLSKPSFIKSHLHRSMHMHGNDEIILVLSDGDMFDSFSVTAHLSLSPHLELANFIRLPISISWSDSETVQFLGSVNGLICFCYDLHQGHFASQIPSNNLVFQIWNPSLSTIFTLPCCQLPYLKFFFTTMYCRFGYDPTSDDYKLVKLIGGGKEWLEVEVYSLRRNSWRLITQSFPSHVTEIFEEDVLCVDGSNGRLHWLGSVGDHEGRKLQTIVAFDLGMETFSELSLPQSVIDHKERCWDILGVMAGKLCVMSHNEAFECEVWVLNEYGVAESWVKHNVLLGLSGVHFPYGFTSSNKFLFETLDGRFGLYDPISGNTKIMASEYRKVKVVRYVESLVWMAPITSR